MKKLKGSISINRTSSNKEGDFISITVKDKTSSCQAISIKMSLEMFASAVTGLSFQECAYEFNDSGLVGKVREYKTEFVPILTKSYARNDDEALKAFKPFEKDGWEGRIEDYFNSHNRNYKDNTVAVSFVRYIDSENETEN